MKVLNILFAVGLICLFVSCFAFCGGLFVSGSLFSLKAYVLGLFGFGLFSSPKLVVSFIKDVLKA